MKKRIENVHYGYPDHRFSHLVFYIVRKPSNGIESIQLNEWIAHVNKSSDLFLDEIYPQYNINRERQETWREIGRARWESPDGIVHFHFRPSGVGYVGIHRQVDVKTDMQRGRLIKALPEHPGLADWIRVVKKSRYMVQAEDQNKPQLAWWFGRKGQRKVLFSWKPPAVWMYQMSASKLCNDPPLADPIRRNRCEKLARDLGATVVIEA